MKRILFGGAVAGALLFGAASLGHAGCGDPPAPKVDWQGCDKTGAALFVADLRGADLRRIILRGANLQGANLQGARLHGANLGGADLRGVNLADADLEAAVITGTRLTYADLSGTRWTDGRTCAMGSGGSCRTTSPKNVAYERWKTCARWCAVSREELTRTQCARQAGTARQECVETMQVEEIDCRSIKCGGESAPKVAP